MFPLCPSLLSSSHVTRQGYCQVLCQVHMSFFTKEFHEDNLTFAFKMNCHLLLWCQCLVCTLTIICVRVLLEILGFYSVTNHYAHKMVSKAVEAKYSLIS